MLFHSKCLVLLDPNVTADILQSLPDLYGYTLRVYICMYTSFLFSILFSVRQLLNFIRLLGAIELPVLKHLRSIPKTVLNLLGGVPSRFNTFCKNIIEKETTNNLTLKRKRPEIVRPLNPIYHAHLLKRQTRVLLL